ncbi:hypothetical protein HPB50_023711 [Hyalomma asiaticum]|uniref:Uncharacterized protein n=1 Tax=Hyalomma asiaticum TaxID=266040 RepID=A0ACB7T918_HYAAI|nr:hypothetical protein HPB50_023711 [Hyalomma asiaticum]
MYPQLFQQHQSAFERAEDDDEVTSKACRACTGGRRTQIRTRFAAGRTAVPGLPSTDSIPAGVARSGSREAHPALSSETATGRPAVVPPRKSRKRRSRERF